MIKLNLQFFGGRGGGSGGGGGGGGGEGTATGVGPGGRGSGGGTGNGGQYTKKEESSSEKSVTRSTGPVLKLEKGEKYDLYRVNDNGTEREYDRNMTSSDVKEVIRGSQPNAKTGLWEDKYGKKYRIRRAR